MLYISKLFLCFIIFSFLGWCLEVLYGMFVLKRFVNRGFLVGPLCPLYGTGCILLYLLLKGYEDDPIMLMLAAMAVCSILEYLTSYLMEKMFKTRWWDYSNMKFNINGRICLEMIIPFGILGLLVVKFLYPTALMLLGKIPENILLIITGIIFTILIVDICVSFHVIMHFTNAALKVPKDMTEEITKFVKETLTKQSHLTKRLVESFPNLQINIHSIKKKIKVMRDKGREKINSLKEKKSN